MPIYVEKIKDKNTGKMIDKKIDGQKQYFIRTYVEDEFGKKIQIKRRNKKWLGRDGYNQAMQEEVRLRNNTIIETVKKSNTNLHDLKELYLTYCSSAVDSDSLKFKKTALNHFCEIDSTHQVTTFPNKPVKLISKEIYMNWKKEMLNKKYTRGKKQFPFSVKRLNTIHNEISSMFEFGITNGYITSNIPKQVGKFGTSKEIKMSNYKKQYQVIDYSEYLSLMNATKNDMKYNTIFDLWFTRGPRPGEMRAFRVRDYDYSKSQLMVNHTLSKSNELKEPKTASSKATIDLDESVNKKINNIVTELKSKPDFSEDWYLFGNKYIPISSNAMEHNKQKYFKIAKIDKHLRLHDFRHSCATWMFSINIPITVISRILRHQDISITMKTYTHLLEKDYETSLKQLDEIRNKQAQNQAQ